MKQTDNNNLKTAFKALSFDEQLKHLQDVAQRALKLWDYPEDAVLKLLNITENATYLVTAPDKRMVMRVHRIDYAEKESIQTELDWILSLMATTTLQVVEPIMSEEFNLVETIYTEALAEHRHVVCFEYVEGKAPCDSNDNNESIGSLAKVLKVIPNAISVPTFRNAAALYHKLNKRMPFLWKNALKPADIAMYETLGAIAAEIHKHSEKWDKPDYYKRIEWNYEATFHNGWNNYYGVHYQQLTQWLKPKEIAILDECAALIQERVKIFGKSKERYGMIHSDLRMSNLLQNGEEITVLDFDDCGQGWYMYDVACICGLMEHRPDLQLVLDAIMNGYQRVRPVDEEDEREIGTFVMMRRIGLLQAIVYHLDITVSGGGESAELTPEIVAFYARGTIILAQEYIEKYSLVEKDLAERQMDIAS